MSKKEMSAYEAAAVRALQRARKSVVDDEVPSSAHLLVEVAHAYAILDLAESIRGGAKLIDDDSEGDADLDDHES